MARNKQLSKDYIEWTLSLNTSQLQTEYGKIVDENKEIQKQANEIGFSETPTPMRSMSSRLTGQSSALTTLEAWATWGRSEGEKGEKPLKSRSDC